MSLYSLVKCTRNSWLAGGISVSSSAVCVLSESLSTPAVVTQSDSELFGLIDQALTAGQRKTPLPTLFQTGSHQTSLVNGQFDSRARLTGPHKYTKFRKYFHEKTQIYTLVRYYVGLCNTWRPGT